jgi:lysophospholipase
MINATDGGPNFTWSSIALDPNFQKGNMPMPLVVADVRNPGETIVGSNSTVVEFNPFEFGSFDPTVFGFTPLEFLGSRYNGGSLPANESCVRGYDNAGFVFGTSSSLFNGFLTTFNTSSLPSIISDLLTGLARKLGEHEEDIAQYVNPFFNYTDNNAGLFASTRELNLVDGGEDLQNIPLHPLIQPERHVDVIFAVDSSADTTAGWPNGASLVATYERSLNSSGVGNGTSFPSIPDQNTFINLGLNTRPTFFGCNSSNTTGPTPLVVYLPNFPYVTYSNVSTFDPQYNTTQRDAIILNGYDLATQANSTRDANWSTCVGCAMLSRSLERTNTNVPAVCNQCFQRYCWNGTVDSRTPPDYEPNTSLTAINLTGSALTRLPNMALLVVGAAASFLFSL